MDGRGLSELKLDVKVPQWTVFGEQFITMVLRDPRKNTGNHPRFRVIRVIRGSSVFGIKATTNYTNKKKAAGNAGGLVLLGCISGYEIRADRSFNVRTRPLKCESKLTKPVEP